MPLSCCDEWKVEDPSLSDLHGLIDKNADGIVVVDPGGIALFCNSAACDLFGRGAEELTGSPIGIPMAVGERTEITVHRPDGGCVEIEMRVVEMEWNGKAALLASLRDISERRHFEERLRQSQKLEAVGRLTAGVAHDFNNLLTIVLGNLDVAQRRHSENPVHHRIPEALANAMEGARRAATLTHQLLAFARRQPLSPDCADPNALIRDMTGLLGRTLGEAVRIESDLADDLWPILIDKSQLESAIVNLAINARDAMDGAGVVTIETSNCDGREIDHGGLRGDFVCISISDTGAGIPDELKTQVFEPFFTTKGVGHGTGLGLSQVYGFVKQSGGYVTIDSEVGVGTTVRLYLPRHLSSSPSAAARASATEPRSCRTILMVEDDDAVRAYARQLLEDMHFDVVEAADADEACEILGGDTELDLMFSDLALPGRMDGRMLAKAAREVRPALQVLLTSAFPGAAVLNEDEVASGFRFLAKPYNDVSLREAIGSLFGGSVMPRVLLVEDDDLVRATLSQSLVEAGCEVVEAANAEQAQSLLSDGLDAAIVDMGLPDGSGDEVVEELKALSPTIPVLVVTGHVDEELHARIGHDSRTAILEKPFENGQLHKLLRALGVLRP